MTETGVAPVRPRRRITWRRVLTSVVTVLLVVVIIYIYGRITAPGRQLRQFAPEQHAAVAPPPNELVVIAYNIAHGRGLAESNWAGDRTQRLLDIAALLRKLDADVVVLNEVDFDSTWSGRHNQAAILAEQAGYPWRVEQRNYDVPGPFFYMRFGNAVLSRYPIVDSHVVHYPDYKRLHTLAAGRKDGVVCTLDLGEGKQVRVLAVHLEVRSPDVRLGSAIAIDDARKAGDVPLIAAGDFNATFDNDKGEMDWYLQQMPLSGADVEGGSFPSDHPRRLIDHVLVSSGLTVTACEVIDTQLSDHRPVRATVSLDNAAEAN